LIGSICQFLFSRFHFVTHIDTFHTKWFLQLELMALEELVVL